MFSTPLICSSIGATTVEATTSALAPGYWPEMLMTGGAISGYCATGNREKATAPRITMTIETTEAKIGRSMKKCDIRMPPGPTNSRILGLRASRDRGSALLLRRDLHIWPDPHQAIDHDAVVRLDAILDDAQVVFDQWPERNVLLHRRVVGIDHQNELADLLGADRGIRHQQRCVGRRARHADAAKHAGGQHAILIREHGATADRARRPVDHVVDEIHGAAMAEILLVEQLQSDDHTAFAARDFLTGAGEPLVAEI